MEQLTRQRHIYSMAEDGPSEHASAHKRLCSQNQTVPETFFQGSCKICAIYNHIIPFVGKISFFLAERHVWGFAPTDKTICIMISAAHIGASAFQADSVACIAACGDSIDL